MITFRKATIDDIDAIEAIYSRVHDEEESKQVVIGWNRNIYPTKESARNAIIQGDMFVEIDGCIVGSALVNQKQVKEYALADWIYQAKDEDAMVLHTLTIDPVYYRKGYGKAFIGFYEDYALKNGCKVLRIDTNENNKRARNMYRKLGYREASIIPCTFNGLEGVNLICLEKKLK